MAQRRGVVCLRACAPVGEGVVAIFWRRQARAHVLRRASSCRLAFCANAQVWTRAQLRAGGRAPPPASSRCGATCARAISFSNSHRGPSCRPKKHDSRYSRVSVGAASAYDMMVAYAGRHAPSTDGDATYVSFVCPREGEHGTSAVGAGCGRGLRAPTDSASLRPPKVHTHSLCRNRSRSRRKPRPAAATTAAGTSEGEGRRRRPRRRVQVSCTEPSRT